MKNLLENFRKNVLIEARVDDVIDRYPEYKQQIRYLSDNDPAGNDKYLAWMAKQVAENHEVPKDVLSAVEKFHKHRHNIDQKDIYQYKSLDNLKAVLNDIGITPSLQKKLKKTKQHDLHKDYEQFAKDDVIKQYEDDEWLIAAPLTTEASCVYGHGAEWCTTGQDSEGNFRAYTEENGVTFVYIHDKKTTPDDKWAKWALVYDSMGEIEKEKPMPYRIFDRENSPLPGKALHKVYSEDVANNLYKIAAIAFKKAAKQRSFDLKAKAIRMMKNDGDADEIRKLIANVPIDNNMVKIIIENDYISDFFFRSDLFKNNSFGPKEVYYMFNLLVTPKYKKLNYAIGSLFMDVCKKKSLPSKIAKGILELFDYSQLKSVAKTGAVLYHDYVDHFFKTHPDSHIRWVYAQSPSIGQDSLMKLINDEDDSVQHAAMRNDMLPRSVIQELYEENRKDPKVLVALMINKTSSPQLVNKISRDLVKVDAGVYEDYLSAVMTRNRIKTETIHRLVDYLIERGSDDKYTLKYAVRNPNADEELIKKVKKFSSHAGVIEAAQEELRVRFGKDPLDESRKYFRKYKNIF